ncbi:MAG TPA: SDR family NAD(P)-dependent oxidoreductase [Telmatospirillum sp.]|nr:SDR family NAD(P)-dependent oxidoreductase [Telmatospirillum sp.]
MPPRTLEGRVAAITGASRGIGWAVAEAFAEAGANLALCAKHHPDDLKERADDLASRHGVTCLALGVDVARADQVAAFSKAIFGTFKRLDVLVNNAGILGDGLLGMIADETIAHVLDVNLAGMIRTMQVAARLLQRSGGGSIINIASIMGTRGASGQVLYAASKAGVVGASLAAAKELGPKGIRVNAVAPGYIDTEMIRGIPSELHRQRVASIVLGRVGLAEDVAKAVLFLASDQSSYITGQVIGVDGGMIL